LRCLSLTDLRQRWNPCPDPDHLSVTQEDTSDDLLLFHAFRFHSEISDDLYEGAPRLKDLDAMLLFDMVDIYLTEARVYTTTSGELEFTKHSLQSGDKVVWFGGGTIPYILRKMEDREAYTLAGYCYFGQRKTQPLGRNDALDSRDIPCSNFVIILRMSVRWYPDRQARYVGKYCLVLDSSPA